MFVKKILRFVACIMISDFDESAFSMPKKSASGTEDILFESEAEKAQYVAGSFDLSGAENFKAAGSMERGYLLHIQGERK